MESSFRDLFNTSELKSVYSNLTHKLIYKKLDDIKCELKAAIENVIDRDTYKMIYRQTIKIKNDFSRKPRNDNIMIPIDILERCLPNRLRDQPQKKDKTRFISQFAENLKSNVDLNVFKKHDQYERLAGWIVGREPQLKWSGDGTVCIVIFNY